MKSLLCAIFGTTVLFVCFPKLELKEFKKPESVILSCSSEQPYKILNIKALDKVYIIYAVRSDSVFEIVSKKDNIDTCKNVKIDSLYQFRLQSQLENKSSILYTPRSNRLLITHVNIYGELIPLEPKARYDLYIAKGLKGLCLKNNSN